MNNVKRKDCLAETPGNTCNPFKPADHPEPERRPNHFLTYPRKQIYTMSIGNSSFRIKRRY